MTGLQRTLAVVALAVAVALGVLVLRHPTAAQSLPRPFTVMRAGQYFGTRTTVPGRSVMTGIAWYGGNQMDKLRGACRDDDGLQRWGWTRHDGVSYGSQFIGDRDNGVDITTEFVKANASDFDGPVAWVVRVRGTRAKKAPRRIRDVTLMLHAFAEAGSLSLADSNDKGLEGDVVVRGSDDGTGSPFTLVWLDNEANKQPSSKLITHLGSVATQTAARQHALRRTHYLGGYADVDTQWRLKDMVSAPLARSLQAVAQQVMDAKESPQAKVPLMRPVLPNSIERDTNTLVLQRTFKVPFQVDIAFVPHATSGADALQVGRDLSAQFADVAANRRAQFDEAFESRFGGESSGMSAEQVETAKAAMSNLLGGMTYFYGSSIVRTPDKKKPFLGPEHELFTAVPSRSFFPRGFLWDEGFHQLVVSRWNPVLTRSAVLSWLRSMDDDGWIAREQILGSEARERVPEQFRVQKPDVANPPTLLLAVQELVRQYHASGTDKQDTMARARVQADGSASSATAVSDELRFFREAFPLMRRQFEWLKRTQRGRDGGFYWRGCKGEHCLASGLDDYPRGDIPSRHDQHVDLLSWLILAARLLADIAPSVGEDPVPFATDAEAMAQHLEAHWNEDAGVFCDIGFMLRRRRPGESKPKGTSQQVCNIGYVTFFPLLLRLVPPDSPRLPRMLEVLSDPQHTWSKFGVRSLAKSHKKFGAGENYWRGAVWINCNYLALQALRHYSHVDGPAQQRAAELRDELQANLVRTINDQYQAKGFLYESYDSDDGHGRGTHPFTGWTSLVVLMLADAF